MHKGKDHTVGAKLYKVYCPRKLRNLFSQDVDISGRASVQTPFAAQRLTRTNRAVDNEIYINLSAHVGAGRQSKAIHTTHIDPADVITGLLDVQFAEDIPV